MTTAAALSYGDREANPRFLLNVQPPAPPDTSVTTAREQHTCTFNRFYFVMCNFRYHLQRVTNVWCRTGYSIHKFRSQTSNLLALRLSVVILKPPLTQHRPMSNHNMDKTELNSCTLLWGGCVLCVESCFLHWLMDWQQQQSAGWGLPKPVIIDNRCTI